MLFGLSVHAQVPLQQQIADIAKEAKGSVAITVLNIETRDSISYNGDAQMVMKKMNETTTGPKQIKGLLPAGTIVGHKTVRLATNDAGLTPATHDVGIITLPNG